MNRLDYAFTDEHTLEYTTSITHEEVGLTDHKMVNIFIGEEKKPKQLLGLWKHNDKLNKETEFVSYMKDELLKYIPLAEKDCETARGAWEAIKGKIRELSRKYSIAKMKQERKEKEECKRILEKEDDNPSKEI